MKKYNNEVNILKSQRDKLYLEEITKIFDGIRIKTFSIANDVAGKAEDNPNYLSEYGRNEKLAKEFNTTLRPDYIKKDQFCREWLFNEYSTAYYQSLYIIENTGISDGFLVRLPKNTEKQFKQAINYPLSKLANNNKMATSRAIDIEQLYTTVVSGVEQGLSLPNINKMIDQSLGYRDSAGNWISKTVDRKGQQYRTMRTLRTEVLRMRSTAEIDQWVNQQPFVPSKLRLIATLDNRTRSQSANMDNQLSNDKGQFLYPDIGYAFPHRTGIAKYDINDRETTITEDPEFPPESRIQRDPNTGKNKVLPFEDFKSYAEKNNLKVNRYGEVLFK